VLSRLAQAQENYDAKVRQYNRLVGKFDLAQTEADLVLAQARLVDAQERYAILKNGPDSNQGHLP